jgi:hypothetical protein
MLGTGRTIQSFLDWHLWNAFVGKRQASFCSKNPFYIPIKRLGRIDKPDNPNCTYTKKVKEKM